MQRHELASDEASVDSVPSDESSVVDPRVVAELEAIQRIMDGNETEFTAVPGQRVTEGMMMLKGTMLQSQTQQPGFDITQAQRWMKAEKRMGWKWKGRVKKVRKRGHKKKKKGQGENKKIMLAALSQRQKEIQEEHKIRQAQLEQARQKLVNMEQVSTCRWTFYDRNSRVEYVCTNDREIHPLAEDQNNYCHYHMIYCRRDHSETGKLLRTLEFPNAHALCHQCWHKEVRGSARRIHWSAVPGVYIKNREAHARLHVIANSVAPKPKVQKNDETKKKTESIVITGKSDERPVCGYSHLHPVTRLRWRCHAKVMRHPTTRKLSNFCGWHQKQCTGTHIGKSPIIECPNQYGLCPAHFASKTGEPPGIIDDWWDIPTVKPPPPRHEIG